MSKVSILMNGYNSEKYVRIAIDSVYAQSYNNWEIVFIDNCSDDRTKSIVDSYDEKIKYYKTPKNISLCHARYFAKDFIDGDFFCVLDTDDLWDSSKLERQVNLMNKYSDVGIIYTNTMYLSERGEESLAYKTSMPSGNLFRELLSNYFFSFETVMVRKSVMDINDIYFDPKYQVSSDAEFFIKLSYYTNCLYIDDVLATWRYGHGSESDRSAFLFPYEYELLLTDLSHMIEGFERDYLDEIQSLKNKINNMYGIAHWSTLNRREASRYFKKASKHNKKYLIPYFLSFLFTHKTYNMLKNKVGLR